MSTLFTACMTRRIFGRDLTEDANFDEMVLTTLENLVISENLLILEISGNLKFTRNLSDAVFFHVIVSNSTLNWLGDSAWHRWSSHHAPEIKYSVILQESCRTDC